MSLTPLKSPTLVQEIESHVYDTLVLQQPLEEGAIETMQGLLGTPRELAEGYIDHITIDVAPPKGLKKPLARVRKGISKSLFYLLCCLAYGCGASMLVLALTKLLYPSGSGVWFPEQRNSVVVYFSQMELQATEIPAVWLIPLTAMLGTGLLYLTRQITRVLKMHI